VAAFVPIQDGAYIALVTQSRELQVEGAKFQSIGTAKFVFAALPSPVVAAARLLTGFDRAVASARDHSRHESAGPSAPAMR
jgi:hypothetical protein